MSEVIEISIIIPTYNVQDYIKRCISSCLEQSFSGSVELVVVDDCGQDESINLVKEFNDPRIKIVTHEFNKGLSAARNTGLEVASGNYVLFLDSDDYVDSNLLEKCFSEIKSADVDFVAFNSTKVDETGQLIKNYWMSRYAGKSLRAYTIDDQEASMIACWDVAAWCKLIKRDFLLSNNIKFDEQQRWFEDHLFSVQLFSLGRFSYIDQVLHFYFQRSDEVAQKSITQEKGTKVAFYRARAILEIANWLHSVRLGCYFKVFLPLFLEQYKVILMEASSNIDVFCQVYSMLRDAFLSFEIDTFQDSPLEVVDFIYVLRNYDYPHFMSEISTFSNVDRKCLGPLVKGNHLSQLTGYVNLLSLLPDLANKKKVLTVMPLFLKSGGYKFAFSPKRMALNLRDFYVLLMTDIFDLDEYNRHSGRHFKNRAIAIVHYLSVGQFKHYSPFQGFSSLGYLEHNPDLSLINMSLFVHFILYAKLEGRKC